MTPLTLFVHVLGERRGDQWSLLCLEFDLAAQSGTLEDAQARLREQIKAYLHDAMEGEDAPYARGLLLRRAPLRYWVLYAIVSLVGGAVEKFSRGASRISSRVPLPLVPAPAC